MGSNRDLGKSRVRFCEVEAHVGDQREDCRFWGCNFECPDFVNDMRYARRLKLGLAAEQNFECPDFVNDVRPAGRPKRGLAAEQNFVINLRRNATAKNVNHVARRGDSDIDGDYEMFLNAGILGNYVNHVARRGDSDIDEDYEVFLNGILGNYSDYTVGRNVISNNSLKNFSKGGNRGTPKISKEVGGGKKILKVRKSTTVKPMALVSGLRSGSSIKIRNKKKVKSAEHKSIPEIHDHYAKFVSGLKSDGRSMIFTTISGEVIRYEGDEECSYDSDTNEDYGNYRDYTVDRNVISNNSLENFSKRGNIGTPKILKEVDGGKKISKVRKSTTVKPMALVSGPISESSIKIRRKKKVKSTEQKSIPEIHDHYAKFVSDLKSDGRSMTFTTISGEVIRYGGDEGRSYDSDIIVMDRDPCQNRIPPLNLHYGTTSDNSEFKEKLMSLLRMPYSQEDYDELWQKASYQRKRKRRPETMTCGRKHRSYFDQFPDLKQKINSVRRDRRKVLNLLRGFFYWLEHVPDEQNFVPWLDPSCLESSSDDQLLVVWSAKNGRRNGNVELSAGHSTENVWRKRICTKLSDK